MNIQPADSYRSHSISAWMIGPALLALGVWFVTGGSKVHLPEMTGGAAAAADISTTPRRIATPDPPVTTINGFDRTCMDCHRMFPAADDPPQKLMQHAHIRLSHGINDRCRNCHDVADRDKLVLHSGERVSFSQVTLLCQKCHGPTYRDWERGMHGRTNGYWDASRGVSRRVGCTECHDPHNPKSPAMDAIKPLPSPRTLRMPTDEEHAAPARHAEDDPLREALRKAAEETRIP